MGINILYKKIEINNRIFKQQVKAHQKVTKQFDQFYERKGNLFNLWNLKELGRLNHQCNYHFMNLQRVQDENKTFLILLEKEVKNYE